MSTQTDRIRKLTLDELTDINGQPMQLNKRFLLLSETSGPGNFRALDWESNKRQIVFNPSRNGGLYLELDNRFFPNSPGSFGIYYTAGGEWLLGNRQDSSDVVLGHNQLSSHWFFANAGKDSHGHSSYEIWTMRYGADQVGDLWLPSSDVGRAGYDGDYEWRTYTDGRTPAGGWFRVKFQLIE